MVNFPVCVLDSLANHEATCVQIQGEKKKPLIVFFFLKLVTISVAKVKYESSWGMEQVIHQAPVAFLAGEKVGTDCPLLLPSAASAFQGVWLDITHSWSWVTAIPSG